MLFLELTQGFTGDGEDTNNGTSRPSLFELLMQDRMAQSIKPAVDYLVHTLCESYPTLALSLPVRRLDETYAVLRFCIESYFLSRYDSLATEKFYGMKRVMLVAAANGKVQTKTSPLTPRARKLALFFAVIVPYLKSKVDAYFRETTEVMSTTTVRDSCSRPSVAHDGENGDRREQRVSEILQRLRSFAYMHTLKKTFVAMYPFAHFAYEGSFFLYQLLYLFGDTLYFSPFLRCMKTILVRVTADDEVVFQQTEISYRKKVMEKLSGSGLYTRIRRLGMRATWAMLDNSYALLLLGVAVFKYIEWMYSEEGVSTKLRLTKINAPIPPPPLPPQFSGQASGLATMNPTTCYICQQKRVNPAMAPSGYVFCYPCIYRYVEQHGECPITQMKCTSVTIVKIYDDGRDL
ncbi:hypothetical protein PsorP6_013938 [Peronosclerospora sorghi]|uniref:Uncharacterized protein n=1 Tax=Peronosclerospora sorghi TaxID=230839 RepID=A0ACC0VHS0_9STRA|nr:hypothetical protein PsorP6_013938 [Peronosclerospora sorghi]